ncbi:twin-arginine translocation pathway signal protein [Albidovulum sp.]
MTKSSDRIDETRRGLLTLAAAAAPAAAAAAALSGTRAEAEEGGGGGDAGYRETPQVRAYYQSARF